MVSFDVAGADGIFSPAIARIEGDTVVASALTFRRRGSFATDGLTTRRQTMRPIFMTPQTYRGRRLAPIPDDRVYQVS